MTFGKGNFGHGYKQQRGGIFPVPRRGSPDEFSRSIVVVKPSGKSEPTGPYMVQGQKASDLEDRVYRMLKRLGWTDDNIQFQTPILGGRKPGGQVLDFVCYGSGAVYVLMVNGDHWHAVGTKAAETLMNEGKIKQAMPAANVLSLFTGDVLTDDIAFYNLSRLVGRGM